MRPIQLWLGICFVAVGVLIIPQLSHAKLTTFFAPNGSRGVVIMQTVSAGEPNDGDPQSFFAAMNVPVETRSGADNKGIQTPNKAILFACNTRHVQDIYTCTLGIGATDHSTISAREGRMEYRSIESAEAQFLFKQFHPNQPDGSFHWESRDGRLKIHATPGEFYFDYH